MKAQVRLGNWTRKDVDRLLQTAAAFGDAGTRIDFISRHFLGIPYGVTTLIGSPSVSEVLVINFEALDCFTYLDYVEAMRLSHSFMEFREALMRVRYRSGRVAYDQRHHFFTDWGQTRRVEDVTPWIAREKVVTVSKVLNREADGSCFVPAIPPVERTVSYVPSPAIDEAAHRRLLTGDYVGIYTETEGLDVSHVGIVIKDGDVIRLRHASSVEGSVTDQDLAAYLSGKLGIVVLRPRG